MRYKCDKCGKVVLNMDEDLTQETEVIYKCKDRDDPMEPGDVTRIYWVCRGGCSDEV